MARISSHSPKGYFTAKRAVEADAQSISTVDGQTLDLAALGARGVLFIVNVGTLGGSGTIDAKVQHSDNGSDWTDYSDEGSPITQITASDGDGAIMGYTSGQKRYVRAVLTIGVAGSDAAITAAIF